MIGPGPRTLCSCCAAVPSMHPSTVQVALNCWFSSKLVMQNDENMAGRRDKNRWLFWLLCLAGFATTVSQETWDQSSRQSPRLSNDVVDGVCRMDCWLALVHFDCLTLTHSLIVTWLFNWNAHCERLSFGLGEHETFSRFHRVVVVAVGNLVCSSPLSTRDPARLHALLSSHWTVFSAIGLAWLILCSLKTLPAWVDNGF